MKNLILITIFIGLYSFNSFASPYIGISFQNNSFLTDTANGDEPINNISALIGYKFEKEKFSPYKLAVELGYLRSKSSSYNYSSEAIPHSYNPDSGRINFNIVSLNTVHHYNINNSSDWFDGIFGIVGLSYAEFKSKEYENREILPDLLVDKAKGIGFNIGAGLTFKIPKSEMFEIRTKVIYTKMPEEIQLSGINLEKVNALVSFSADFIVHF